MIWAGIAAGGFWPGELAADRSVEAAFAAETASAAAADARMERENSSHSISAPDTRINFCHRSHFFGATAVICVIGACLRARLPPTPHFCLGCGGGHVKSIKIDLIMLGTDSARSFYFAVQQLFVLGGVGKPSRPWSCRCPSPKISNCCEIYQS